MLYSSLLFIYGFLPMSLLVFYLAKQKYRDGILLALSLVFCAFCGLRFMLFMVCYAVFNYFMGILTDNIKKSSKSLSAFPLFIGIITDIMVIFMFRAEYMSWLRNTFGFPDKFFPLGISFIVLSSIGYLIDIYCGRIKSEKNIITFGLYILMFPKFIAGPVLRYHSFVKINKSRKYGLSEIGKGLVIFIKGLAKKIIIADTMYRLYNDVSNIETEKLCALNAWLGIIAYMLCLYFTLSGMCDMGTGIGYCFGYRFPNSFNYPIFSSKIRYFASKWHIQVVRWFRLYIAKPLYKLTKNNWIRRILFISAWCLAGFWYTFSINGAVWGCLMGISITCENFLIRKKLLKATGIIYTFFIVSVLMAFLAGDSTGDSVRYILIMFGGNRLFADSISIYFFKSYVVLLLLSMYASTDLFRNMILRSGKSKLKTAFSVISPVIAVLLLIVCTALISYRGVSDMIPIKL
ncbi:MAG: MBOAT family protein [Ruminococcus sp.]|nr:MBOAT family protein [Ruminococcus sp.]